MQHLSLENLARLLEEAATAEEAAHLEACPACHAELDGLRRQAEALARLGPIEPPATAWPELEARLQREGLLTPAAGAGVRAARPWGGRLLRIAAALVLYAAGAGTVLALRVQPRPARMAATGGATVTAPAQPIAPAPAVAEPTATAVEPGPAATPTAAAPEPSPRLTAATPDQGTERATPAATPEEAIVAVRAAERQYQAAYARYAELTDGQQLEDPVTRLAALESIVLTTREALDRAPADPVINGYHLTAVAQRDAALRQIALRSDGRWF